MVIKKTMSIFLISILSAVAFSAVSIFAQSESNIIKGVGGIANYELSRLPKNENHELLIEKRNDNYYWVSNQNKILKKIEKELVDPKEGKISHTIFLNPDGEGLIIIKHMPSNIDDPKLGCDQSTHNYLEYRLNNRGGFTPYSGITKPFPYPKPHKCPKNILNPQ